MAVDLDDEDNEGRTQTYICQSAGHAGEDRGFDDKAEELWIAPMSPPRHCHVCRSWIKKQEANGPIPITCAECKVEFNISAQRRISHHKGTGPWVEPRYCDGCEHDPGRRSRSTRDNAKNKYKELRQRKGQPAPRQPDDTGLGAPEQIRIPTDLNHYFTTLINRDDGKPMPTIDYIMRHPEFEGMSSEEVLRLMLHAAMSTSSSARQVVARNGRVNKGDLSTGYVLVVDTSRYPPPFINFFQRKDRESAFEYLKRKLS